VIKTTSVKMHTGYITFYHRKKKYGFIDSWELDLQDIFFHYANCKKEYKNIIRGDRVEFDIGKSTELLFKYEANNIAYLGNSSKENLKKSFTEQTFLKGFVKIIDGNYFVKDKESYVMIKLCISQFEDLGGEYENNLNKRIEYKIIDYSSTGKIKAVKANRQFSSDYYLLKSQKHFFGKTIEKIKGGYIIRLSNNIVGYLPSSLLVKANKTLEINEDVRVFCIKINENTGNVVFDVAENNEK
jgi:cold shock CspA family protein